MENCRTASGLNGSATSALRSILSRFGISRDGLESEDLVVMSLEMPPRFFVLSRKEESETSANVKSNRCSSSDSKYVVTPLEFGSDVPSFEPPNVISGDDVTTDSSMGSSIGKEKEETKAEEAINVGNAHLNRSGKYTPAASMKPPCDCKKECRVKIPEEDRKLVHESYWKLGDRRQQWEYVVRHSSNKEVTKRTRGDGSRRNFSRQYFFEVGNAKTRIFVCKTMFMNTLDISSNVIQSAYNHLSNGTVSPCLQGKHNNRRRRISD